uniref:Uncharacterized protein n=1 Tax=Strigamia maritima TaxID=126957 RepID=T1JD79_STRMM
MNEVFNFASENLGYEFPDSNWICVSITLGPLLRFYCYCCDHDAEAVTKPEEVSRPYTTPIPSSVIIPSKCTSGWTEWFNIDSPEKDEEIIDVKCESVEFATKQNYQFKGAETGKDEQPPTISTTPYYVGPTVALVSNTKINHNEFDMDYPDEDDIEQEFFADVKNFAQMCPIVDCVQYYTPANLDEACTFKATNYESVRLVTTTSQTKDKQYSDYKIATPELLPLVVTPLCADCAYDCDDVCHSFLVQAHTTGECPNKNESNCIAGCLKDECRSSKVWRDQNVIFDGQQHYVKDDFAELPFSTYQSTHGLKIKRIKCHKHLIRHVTSFFQISTTGFVRTNLRLQFVCSFSNHHQMTLIFLLREHEHECRLASAAVSTRSEHRGLIKYSKYEMTSLKYYLTILRILGPMHLIFIASDEHYFSLPVLFVRTVLEHQLEDPNADVMGEHRD